MLRSALLLRRGDGLSRLRSMSTLNVAEMFTSVQGEGPFSGRPSLFLRLGMCNLECVWCDTKYTWLYSEGQLKRIRESVPENIRPVVGTTVYKKRQELVKHSVQEVVEKILDQTTGEKIVRSVVITGGEPLLHKLLVARLIPTKNQHVCAIHDLVDTNPVLKYVTSYGPCRSHHRPLLDLCPALLENGYHIEVETNGTLSPQDLPEQIHYNVSAKLSNSFQSRSKRVKPKVLKEFASLRSVLKDDLTEAQKLAEEAGFPPERIFLMPEGTEASTLSERGRWLVDRCLERGYNYSHRVHVSLWGDLRGV